MHPEIKKGLIEQACMLSMIAALVYGLSWSLEKKANDHTPWAPVQCVISDSVAWFHGAPVVPCEPHCCMPEYSQWASKYPTYYQITIQACYPDAASGKCAQFHRSTQACNLTEAETARAASFAAGMTVKGYVHTRTGAVSTYHMKHYPAEWDGLILFFSMTLAGCTLVALGSAANRHARYTRSMDTALLHNHRVVNLGAIDHPSPRESYEIAME